MAPIINSSALEAQLANAQYNINNAAYSPASAAAVAALQASNPSVYSLAIQQAEIRDAAAEAAKYARFNNTNPLGGLNPAQLANMPQSEIANRYGPDVANAVNDYFRANPSARFQTETAKYAVQRQMSATGYSPLLQVPGGRFGTPEREIEIAKPSPPSPYLNNPNIQAEPTPSTFENVSNLFKNAPVLSFFYNAGASVPKSEVVKVDTAIRSNPILSNIRSGGGAYELQTDYSRQLAINPSVTPASETQYVKSAGELTGGFNSKDALTYDFGEKLQNFGKSYNETITVPASKFLGENPLGQFLTGVISAPGELISTAGQAIPGAEIAARNPGNLPALAAAGTAMFIGGMYESATTNPARLAGSLAGQALIFGGAKAAYEYQPYRIGIERATLIPSSGEGAASAKYSSLAISKLSGADYQIAQVKQALIGTGGKVVNPVETVLKSDLLKTTTDARFSTKENTFTTSSEAMAHFNEVAESQRNFYHATTTGNLGDTLLTTGKITVQESHPGGLFFAEPETILTKYAKGPGVPVALKLTDVPKITPEYLRVVSDVKAGRAGAFGPEFVKTTSQLQEGFYPGVRPAAGKSFGTYGLEEEYIVTPGTTLYLKSLRSMAAPSGEKWLLAEVSLKRPLIPDIARGAIQTIADIKNLRPTIGVPKVPNEYFNFGKPELTFAPNTPLETSIVKRLVPAEAPKIDLGYGVIEITSGSGMRLQNAATAINEVVRANKFPNPGKVTQAILQTEIDYNVKMYGSSIQRGAGTEKGITTLTRAPNDIDVFVPQIDGKSMGQSFASDVTAAINRAAGKRVVEIDPAGTVSLTNGKGKLFDIHNENPTTLELLSQGSNPNKPGSQYYGVGMKPEKYLETTEGVGVMTYSEQVSRKLSGTSEFTPEPRTILSKVYEGGPEEFSVSGQIAPRFEGRMKDIPDFYTGQKGSIELMERSANPVTQFKAQQANAMLEQWLDQWGEATAKNVRENYQVASTARNQKYAIDFSGVGKYESEFSPASTFIKSSVSSSSIRPYSQSISIKASPQVSGPSERSAEFSQSVLRGASTSNFSQSISQSANVEFSGSATPSQRELSQNTFTSPAPSKSIVGAISPIPVYETSRGTQGSPSITAISTFISDLYLPPSYSNIPSPSSTRSPQAPNSSPPSSIIWPSPSSKDFQNRKKKQQPYYLFRELLPTITPIEMMGGFKSGKPFFRAIGNQQILEVKPQQRDWIHSVDIDVDIRDLEQNNKNTADKTSDLAGVHFFRTATKQEKAKTGKPIITYTPTKQELDMATLTGIRKPRKGRNRSW